MLPVCYIYALQKETGKKICSYAQSVRVQDICPNMHTMKMAFVLNVGEKELLDMNNQDFPWPYPMECGECCDGNCIISNMV